MRPFTHGGADGRDEPERLPSGGMGDEMKGRETGGRETSHRTIAIMNQKGGVGKTTTAINLGAALAELGKRVLLVDLDSQANLTRGLGVEVADLDHSTYDSLTNPHADITNIIQATRWKNLDVAPSHIDLSGAEIEMVPMFGREVRLVNAMSGIDGRYDYILIDCLPSLSLLTVNAMVAATEIFVPMQAHPFALQGLGKLFEVYEIIRAQMNPALRLTGVLVTMFDTRTNVSKGVMEALMGDPRTADVVFTTLVRQNIRIAESQKVGVPIIHYDSTCHGAVAYRELAREVMFMEAAVRRSSAPEAAPAGKEAEMAVASSETDGRPDGRPDGKPDGEVQDEIHGGTADREDKGRKAA